MVNHRRRYMRWSAEVDETVRRVTCWECGVHAGELCRRRPFNTARIWPHKKRWALMRDLLSMVGDPRMSGGAE